MFIMKSLLIVTLIIIFFTPGTLASSSDFTLNQDTITKSMLLKPRLLMAGGVTLASAGSLISVLGMAWLIESRDYHEFWQPFFNGGGVLALGVGVACISAGIYMIVRSSIIRRDIIDTYGNSRMPAVSVSLVPVKSAGSSSSVVAPSLTLHFKF